MTNTPRTPTAGTPQPALTTLAPALPWEVRTWRDARCLNHAMQMGRTPLDAATAEMQRQQTVLAAQDPDAEHELWLAVGPPAMLPDACVRLEVVPRPPPGIVVPAAAMTRYMVRPYWSNPMPQFAPRWAGALCGAAQRARVHGECVTRGAPRAMLGNNGVAVTRATPEGRAFPVRAGLTRLLSLVSTPARQRGACRVRRPVRAPAERTRPVGQD